MAKKAKKTSGGFFDAARIAVELGEQKEQAKKDLKKAVVEEIKASKPSGKPAKKSSLEVLTKEVLGVGAAASAELNSAQAKKKKISLKGPNLVDVAKANSDDEIKGFEALEDDGIDADSASVSKKGSKSASSKQKSSSFPFSERKKLVETKGGIIEMLGGAAIILIFVEAVVILAIILIVLLA